jgi:hypothetical protein
MLGSLLVQEVELCHHYDQNAIPDQHEKSTHAFGLDLSIEDATSYRGAE